MVDVTKRKRDRLLVMNDIFSLANGNSNALINPTPIGESLGLSDMEFGDICNYLAGEGLIEIKAIPFGSYSPALVGLTHVGIKEMERSVEAPENPTQHFPPYVSIVQNFHGDIVSSQVLTNSNNNELNLKIDHAGIENIQTLLRAYEKEKDHIDLDAEQRREIDANMKTIKAQLNGPNPARTIVKFSIETLRSIFQNTATNIATPMITEALKHIRI